MRKFIIYLIFALASLVVAGTFITSDSYLQLGIAITLYPLLVFFAYKLFLKGGQKVSVVTVPISTIEEAQKSQAKTVQVQNEGGVTDNDKRDFLKMIGAAGLSFFLFSIFNRRQPFFLGNSEEPKTTSLEDTSGNKINPAISQPTDSYIISEIDESYVSFYGFINKDGGWFIMREDPDDGSFRYAKGDSDFSGNWTGRESQNYDYYHNVFN